MSWGIDFKADIYLSKQDYSENIFQVQDRIKELNDLITSLIAELKMYASATPSDIVPKEWELEKIRWLNTQIDEIMENLLEYNIEANHLELYKDYLNGDKDPRI